VGVPAIPQNVYLQQANGQTFLSWDISAGATSYSVKRSTDGVTFSSLATPATNYYLDSTVTVATQYYYQVASTNASGTSSYIASSPNSIVPTNTGNMSLGQVRLLSQQRADRVNSNFVTLPEWNTYINQSYFELYDLLVTEYEDYYVTTPYTFATDGNAQYTLPTDFYKLLGVDIGMGNSNDAFVTVKKFDFISRNRYVFPNITSTYLGVFNLQYRLMGNTIFFIPTPAGGQTIRLWYVPRMTELLQDSDMLDGISGWTEYVVVEAAIKALQKEESDVSALMAQKQGLIKRIQDAAMNRDAGQGDTISDVRNTGWAGYIGGGYDGSWGGF
jgi:hypothetical protein